jgi:hypothetical protein
VIRVGEGRTSRTRLLQVTARLRRCSISDVLAAPCLSSIVKLMRLVLILFAIFALAAASAQQAATYYVTKPNTTGYPFPTAFPVPPEGKVLSESLFDWKRYIGEAISEGDKIFRAHVAFSNGFTSQNTEIFGVQESASDEMARNQIAADEVSKGCVLIEDMYRERLKDDAELLKTLEEFITHHRKAIAASVKLVGGSWDGGSGARVAYPAARLDAFVLYRAALLNLRSSLHFQDFPVIVFPTPGKTVK